MAGKGRPGPNKKLPPIERDGVVDVAAIRTFVAYRSQWDWVLDQGGGPWLRDLIDTLRDRQAKRRAKSGG